MPIVDGESNVLSPMLRGLADAQNRLARAAIAHHTDAVPRIAAGGTNFAAVGSIVAKLPCLTGFADALSPVTAALKAQQSMFRQALPGIASVVDPWSGRLAAIQSVARSVWVAHRSALDEIADVMQQLAVLRTLPRTRGLARTMGRLWQRALDAGREMSRRAVAKFTGQRTDINPRFLGPALWKVPDEHLKLKRTLVLGFTQDHYVIRELLIRAPGLGGSPRPALERSPGEALCPMNTRPPVPMTKIG